MLVLRARDYSHIKHRLDMKRRFDVTVTNQAEKKKTSSISSEGRRCSGMRILTPCKTCLLCPPSPFRLRALFSIAQSFRVWNAITGETEAGPFTGYSNPGTSAAFSPDGQCIRVISSRYRSIHLLNATRGKAAETAGQVDLTDSDQAKIDDEWSESKLVEKLYLEDGLYSQSWWRNGDFI